MQWGLTIARLSPEILSVLSRRCVPVSKSALRLPNTVQLMRAAGTDAKLAKDVILYKYDNARFYKYLNAFALVQFFFWGFLGKFSISSMRNVPVSETVDENLPWWKKMNLGEAKYKNSMQFVCYFLGATLLGCAWLFTLRSVRYVILSKTADKVSLVTYAPFGENRIITVPLEKMRVFNASKTLQE